MTPKTGIERALEIREELFHLANSYAGDETGGVAGMLHQACNSITKAERALKGTYDADAEIMTDFLKRTRSPMDILSDLERHTLAEIFKDDGKEE